MSLSQLQNSMWFLISTLLLLWMLLSSSLAQADQQVVYLHKEIQRIDLGTSAYTFDNSNGDFSAEQIIQGGADNLFVKNYQSFIRNESSNQEYWIRLKFSQQQGNANPGSWFLSISQSYFEILDVYFLDEQQQLVQEYHREKYQDTKGITYPENSFEFFLEEDESVTVYLSIRNLNKLVTRVSISSAEFFAKESIKRSLLEGGFYGALLIIFLYNLFIYINIKDKIHLYYSLYVLMCGVCFFGIDKLAKEYTGANSFFHTDFSQASSSMLMLVFFLLFIREHLELDKLFPKLDVIYKLYFIFILISIICFALVSSYLLFLLTYAGLILYILLSLYPLAVLSFRKNKNALVILIAYLLPIFFATFYIFSDLGWISMEISKIGMLVKFGFIVEFSILSFALGNRLFVLRKESYEFQKRAIKNLEESDLLKQQFLATISHEFRNPMNGVQGSLELIGLAKDLQEVSAHVDNAKASAKHMMNVIADILEFLELSNNDAGLEVVYFDLEELLDFFFKKYNERFQKKMVTFKISNLAVGRYYFGDVKRIRVALKHLLDNAAKFTRQGSVELLVSDHASSGKTELYFRIIDTGVGIPLEKQDVIFSFFRQGDASTSRSFGGLGLGLTIAKIQIDRLGGRLFFESTYEQGSTFFVTIPVQLEFNEKHLAKKTSEPILQTGIKDKTRVSQKGLKNFPVLLVEDNALNRSVLTAMLESLGFQVAVCVNGKEAVEWCQKNQASIILMDCQMPVMDGFEAARQIRADGNLNSEIAIIAVTGNVSEQEMEQCFAAGMDQVLTKPIQKADVARILNQWVDAKGSFE